MPYVTYTYNNKTVYFASKESAISLEGEVANAKRFDLTGGAYKMSATKVEFGKPIADNKKQWQMAKQVASEAKNLLDGETPAVIVNCKAGVERTALVAAHFYMLTATRTASQAKAWLKDLYGGNQEMGYGNYDFAGTYLDAADKFD